MEEVDESLRLMRQKFAKILQNGHLGSKGFFKRISGRQIDHSITRLVRAGATVLQDEGSLAGKMAKGWTPVIAAAYPERTRMDWQQAIS